MKALWLCPIMLPGFAGAFNEKRNPKGGWITGLFSCLKDHISIDICCPAKECLGWGKELIDGTMVYTLKRTEDCTDTLKEILISSDPDIIHIWGTEKKMSLDMVNAAEQLGMLDRVVINIQGLASICSRYHFFCNLPVSVIQSESPGEYKYKVSLQNQRDNMALQGSYEIEAFKKVKHAVGRTDWDYACVTQINPDIHYHKCSETLRSIFYERKWEYDRCEKHSIFVSQSHAPFKGFHMMLEAMPLILKKYPDAKLYTTGKKPVLPVTFEEKCMEMAYPSYIAGLIKDYGLEECVEFTGFLGEKKMCERYLSSNVAVSASSIENSSNSVGEAMLLGMPVVASDVGGTNNFIEHKKNGYLYPADAPYMLAHYVCEVFGDAEKAAAMGERARQFALECFDKAASIERYKEIYEAIVGSATEQRAGRKSGNSQVE